MRAEIISTRTSLDRARLNQLPPIVWLSGLLGALPILSGLMFRTYWFHVEPNWYESLRQFDFPFFPAELATVFVAHARGMTFRGLYQLLDRPARTAVLFFLATFWLGSAFLSEHPLYSLMRCGYWLTHIAFGCAIFYLVRTAPARNVRVLSLVLFVGLVAYLPLLIVHFALAPDPHIVRNGKIIWTSAIPGCLSVRHIGIHAAAVLALSAATAVVCRDERLRRWMYVAVLVSAVLLFWSGTRCGLYGFIGSCLVTALMLGRLPALRPTLAVSLLLALAVPLSVLWLPPDSSFGIVAISSTTNSAGDFSHGRLGLWLQHWPLFLSSPWLGHGEGATYWLTVSGDDHHVQPHNSIIQFVIGWGLIPTIVFGYLAVRGWLLVHRKAALQSSLIPLTVMLNCLLVMSLVDGALYFTRMTMLVAVAVALVLAAPNRGRSPPEAS